MAKPSTDVAPMLKWGNAYQPADVNMQPGDSLNRTQWIEARTFWLSRTNGFLYIACRAQLTLGVAIWRSVGAKWAKIQPLADAKHGPLPLPVYALYAHDVRPAELLASVAAAREGGFTNHDAKILPTDVRVEMSKRKSAYQ